MEAPFSLENDVWKIAVGENPEDLEDYICADAVIMINGKRFSGKTFIDSYLDAPCLYNTIDEFEVVVNEDSLYQVTYKTIVKRVKEVVEIEKYNITTTWKCIEDNYFLIFAMAEKQK